MQGWNDAQKFNFNLHVDGAAGNWYVIVCATKVSGVDRRAKLNIF